MADRGRRLIVKPKDVNRSFLTDIDDMNLDELVEGAKVEGNFEGECMSASAFFCMLHVRRITK